MAVHKFHGKVSAQAGSAADELVTKTQLDTGVADAKNLANATGTTTVSKLSDFTSAVNTLISAVIDGAPGALDTLNELAAALGDDANFAATTATALGALDTRLDVIEAAPAGTRVNKTLVGNGAASSFVVTHGWALSNRFHCIVEVTDTTGSPDGQIVYPVVTKTSVNTVTVDFGATVPTSNQFLVIIKEM